MNKSDWIQISARLPKDLDRRLERVAFHEDKRKNDIVLIALETAIKKLELRHDLTGK